jgi:hypothetical protein
MKRRQLWVRHRLPMAGYDEWWTSFPDSTRAGAELEPAD